MSAPLLSRRSDRLRSTGQRRSAGAWRRCRLWCRRFDCRRRFGCTCWRWRRRLGGRCGSRRDCCGRVPVSRSDPESDEDHEHNEHPSPPGESLPPGFLGVFVEFARRRRLQRFIRTSPQAGRYLVRLTGSRSSRRAGAARPQGTARVGQRPVRIVGPEKEGPRSGKVAHDLQMRHRGRVTARAERHQSPPDVGGRWVVSRRRCR